LSLLFPYVLSETRGFGTHHWEVRCLGMEIFYADQKQ